MSMSAAPAVDGVASTAKHFNGHGCTRGPWGFRRRASWRELAGAHFIIHDGAFHGEALQALVPHFNVRSFLCPCCSQSAVEQAYPYKLPANNPPSGSPMNGQSKIL